MTKIIIIAACAKNGTIGKDGHMPWHLPEDLKFFKKTTLESPMIMGRVTRDSFGPTPLPKRPHIVVTRNKDYSAQQSVIKYSIEDAISFAKETYPDKNIYVIGGADIYKQSLPFADEIILSEIHEAYDGDRTFPEFDHSLYIKQLIEDYKDFTVWSYLKKYGMNKRE
ncbi:MAG: dihydrofolate reductase [Pseudomonadota bacterium]